MDFNTEIRPVLNQQCVSCHGGVRRRAELSLQFREDALTGGKSGEAAIVPGDPDGSPLIQLVSHPDESARMPKDAPALSDEEVDRLRRWIAQGAQWETHWSYVPPEKPVVPETGDWAVSPLDHFIRARMDGEGLSPASESNCHVLGRRVSLDLVGLPADPDRLDALCETPLTDDTFGAYVDELLGHPGFGERWATMWLDLARYADTKGYEKDSNRSIWKYRDWVINAFNDDMPFDQFTVEQLAGDLLPNPTEEQLIATAYHRNSIANDEGGTYDEEFRMASVIERVGNTYEVWMGTTFACVQCHSHPYDPFKHEEFYQSMTYFNNTEDSDLYNEQPKLYTYEPKDAANVNEIIQWLECDLDSETSQTTNASLYAQKEAVLDALGYRVEEAED
ncbi:MAG: DUF1549 domain-containing protein, partial [Rhodothermales bacterium]|nr:DUF1549 domain-containing protein [Rhodothermales bacterium]